MLVTDLSVRRPHVLPRGCRLVLALWAVHRPRPLRRSVVARGRGCWRGVDAPGPWVPAPVAPSAPSIRRSVGAVSSRLRQWRSCRGPAHWNCTLDVWPLTHSLVRHYERVLNRNGVVQTVWISVRICLALSEYKWRISAALYHSFPNTTYVSRCFYAYRYRRHFDSWCDPGNSVSGFSRN